MKICLWPFHACRVFQPGTDTSFSLLSVVSESHHYLGGFKVKHSAHFSEDDSLFCQPTTGLLHTFTDFLPGCPRLVKSRDHTGFRLVPGTDNNASHWSSHTNTAPCFASFQGWASWKNVKHPGNPWGALVAWHRLNKFVLVRRLTCHLLPQNGLEIHYKFFL